MANELRRITFTVTLADPDKWSNKSITQYRPVADFCIPQDWARTRLRNHMREAGEQFIRDHPDLFAVKEIS